ncbi:sperm-tail PG-rich repeat-containing protein 2-like [Aethina tumida]|uniref:sperm-tail PG-rich repeat-containing protein 2-like n=1 Tax=Aethina tumida TaxID=116153 RepID=UPI002147B2A8|nr:sperm-tail PG-rich repeat-containing protein 2-like [Aethina tumida]
MLRAVKSSKCPKKELLFHFVHIVMHNLSPRWRPTVANTPELVGPYTYYLDCVKICPKRKQNYAPFLRCAKLERSVGNPSFTDKFYTIPNTRKIKGGSSLQNRAPRFLDKADDQPGPGFYSPERAKFCKDIHNAGGRRLYANRVEYCFGISAPSIPTRIDENGYDIDQYGMLAKMPPNTRKDYVGPQDYDIRECICCSCEQYRGCKWSKSKTKRFDYHLSENPGPGAYELQIPKDPQQEAIEDYRQMARLFSYLPRYLDQQEMRQLRENYPSPQEYSPEKLKCKRLEGWTKAPFCSTTNRFKEVLVPTPGPTDYDVKHINDMGKITCGPKNAPPQRFKQPSFDGPSPASYNIKSPLQEKLDSKSNKYAVRTAPFLISSPLELPNHEVRPAPNAYTLPDPFDVEEENSSVFKSKVKRFPTKCNLNDSLDFPDVQGSFEASQTKKSFNVKNLPFNHTSYKKEVFSTNPDPGSYHYDLSWSDGRTIQKEFPRFKQDKFRSPGVGVYNIHPKFEVATYRAWDTFNLPLKERVMRKKIKLNKKESFKAWCKWTQKPKQLKWFQETHDYALPF